MASLSPQQRKNVAIALLILFFAFVFIRFGNPPSEKPIGASRAPMPIAADSQKQSWLFHGGNAPKVPADATGSKHTNAGVERAVALLDFSNMKRLNDELAQQSAYRKDANDAKERARKNATYWITPPIVRASQGPSSLVFM
jgi:hypothetical protein